MSTFMTCRHDASSRSGHVPAYIAVAVDVDVEVRKGMQREPVTKAVGALVALGVVVLAQLEMIGPARSDPLCRNRRLVSQKACQLEREFLRASLRPGAITDTVGSPVSLSEI